LGTLESSGVLWSSPEFPKFNYFLLMHKGHAGAGAAVPVDKFR